MKSLRHKASSQRTKFLMLHNGEESEVSVVNTEEKELSVSSPNSLVLVTVSWMRISFRPL